MAPRLLPSVSLLLELRDLRLTVGLVDEVVDVRHLRFLRG
jgi:hypothetical protein